MHAIFYQGHLEVLPGPVRFYQGPGPYGPWCSYATANRYWAEAVATAAHIRNRSF